MNRINEILFVSSFPPRECGIATYTQDLINAIDEKFGKSFSQKVCALENNNSGRQYSSRVKYVLDVSDHPQYETLAEKINHDKNIKLVFLQHEFGLYSGEYGEDVLFFLYALHKPVITVFHTVLPNPDDKRKQIVNAIVKVSDSVIVMTENAAKIMREEYFVPAEKISVIYHGTHLTGSSEKNIIKAKYALEGRQVLSTFGLLSPGKSIETALDALPSIIEKFPDVLYLVLGKTHPEVVKHEGEKYRKFLEARINELGIHNHVKFINRYLSLNELLEYLQLTDIYLFTSKDPNQAVSGTFAYAMGCLCPVISTPIPHAKEMLCADAGIIVDFQNPVQLADAAKELLSSPEKRKRISTNALHKIRPTSWQNSAIAHAELFKKVIGREIVLHYSYPETCLNHIKRLTTGDGMIQFSEINKPDLNSGYTLDDNARALIAMTKHYEVTRNPSDMALINVYLDFIIRCQRPSGKFMNYVDRNRIFHVKNNYVNLEDSMGRAIWALGEYTTRGHLFNGSFLNRAELALKRSLPHVKKFESPRAIAFAIKGLYHYNLAGRNDEVKNIISELAGKLVSKYRHVSDAGWNWFEEYLTYANSILPEAMLYSYLNTGNGLHMRIAKTTFDFLLSVIFPDDHRIRVVSNRSWHRKGIPPHPFGEQPIDVAYTILALNVFYEVFGDKKYRDKLETAFSWFHGNNHLHQIIYNPATGGCCDGLEEHNVNLNQGAESTVCYLLARMTMEQHMLKAEKETMIKRGTVRSRLRIEHRNKIHL